MSVRKEELGNLIIDRENVVLTVRYQVLKRRVGLLSKPSENCASRVFNLRFALHDTNESHVVPGLLLLTNKEAK
jgi:hypothetical protein